jgi:nanoRNase/pAp phosphatase (c-di-AMP/oligoRNAs hydrolase)
MSDWTDSVVGERMALDQEFSDRVRASEFTSQEWSLVMTAVEFEIEHPDDPERAAIVVDDSNLDQIVPELDTIREQMQGMGAAGGRSTGGSSGGGVLDGVKNALGLGGGGGGDHDQKAAAAADLAQEYATELQTRLEAGGRWEEVRTIAAATPDDDGADGDAGDTDADAV